MNMTQDEYQQTYYCNCPKCSELPTLYRSNDKGQWAVCEPCNIHWFIGRDVLEDCQQDSDSALRSLTQVLVERRIGNT